MSVSAPFSSDVSLWLCLVGGVMLGCLAALLFDERGGDGKGAPAVAPAVAPAAAAAAAPPPPPPKPPLGRSLRLSSRTLSLSDDHLASMMSPLLSSPSSRRCGGSFSPLPHGDCSMLVFSGGTAFNKYVRTLARQMEDVTYVLPVSDNGGSTAEILRVLGGPAIGDIRSRLLRLSSTKTEEARAVLDLLQHRLPLDWGAARTEWSAIVDGTHRLWTEAISETYKQMIRTFLVHFHCQMLQQDRGTFDFTNGSTGNFFFTGARMFFDSLEAAIFLWSRLAGIPFRSAVVPVISTNHQMTLVAQLDDALGTTLHGQQAISHPSEPASGRGRAHTVVDKAGSGTASLGANIRRIWYVNEERHLITPVINPVVLEKMQEAQLIVYGMGSLWTSIMPCLLLAGTGKAIAAHEGRKVLLLNGQTDRESGDMDAKDMIKAMTRVIATNEGGAARDGFLPLLSLITDVLVPRGTQIHVDYEQLRSLGLVVEEVASDDVGFFDSDALVAALIERCK